MAALDIGTMLSLPSSYGSNTSISLCNNSIAVEIQSALDGSKRERSDDKYGGFKCRGWPTRWRIGEEEGAEERKRRREKLCFMETRDIKASLLIWLYNLSARIQTILPLQQSFPPGETEASPQTQRENERKKAIFMLPSFIQQETPPAAT